MKARELWNYQEHSASTRRELLEFFVTAYSDIARCMGDKSAEMWLNAAWRFLYKHHRNSRVFSIRDHLGTRRSFKMDVRMAIAKAMKPVGSEEMKGVVSQSIETVLGEFRGRKVPVGRGIHLRVVEEKAVSRSNMREIYKRYSEFYWSKVNAHTKELGTKYGAFKYADAETRKKIKAEEGIDVSERNIREAMK